MTYRPSTKQRYDWHDGTSERTPIKVGDTVLVIAYGEGATLEDVRMRGQVTGFGRTRVKVHLTRFGTPTDTSISPACLKVVA